MASFVCYKLLQGSHDFPASALNFQPVSQPSSAIQVKLLESWDWLQEIEASCCISEICSLPWTLDIITTCHLLNTEFCALSDQKLSGQNLTELHFLADKMRKRQWLDCLDCY